MVITCLIISTLYNFPQGKTLRSILNWSQQEIITPLRQLWIWSKHHFGWTLLISVFFNLLVFICFPSSWIPTQIQSKIFDEITIEVSKGRMSTLKFKQQHHLWVANCALVVKPVQTLCDQSVHRHQFTVRQVEIYYLQPVFWNLKNSKKEVFIHQLTVPDPRQQHFDMAYTSTFADFEKWKRHITRHIYVVRGMIALNFLWLFTLILFKSQTAS